MYTITIWNEESPNYNANAFVKTHGTATIQMKSESAAMGYMTCMIKDPLINSIVIEGPRGRLNWIRHRPDESRVCDDCGPDGDCDTCELRSFPDDDNVRDCGGYPGDEDDQEFDINDPRR